jgi:NADH-quinone oxidoreductase subunit G
VAEQIAEALRSAARPVIVSGTGAHSLDVIRAAANVAWAARHRRGAAIDLFFAVPECNSVGVALLDPLPLGRALEMVEQGEAETVIVLENDLFRRASRTRLDPVFARARSIVVIDHVATETGARAKVVLPSTPFSEAAGTLVNHEGRAQPFFRVVPPAGARDAWRWIRDLMGALDRPQAEAFATVDHVRALICDRETFCVPPPMPRAVKLPRALPRFSGRTALDADRTVHEPPPPLDPDSPYAFSMEGSPPPAAFAQEFWWPGWNSIQALTRFTEEIGGPLRGERIDVRLLHPDPEAPASYFPHPPLPFEKQLTALFLLARPLVFGTEELSSLSPPVAARAPELHLALSPADAARAGPTACVSLDGRLVRLPVVVLPGLPEGIALLPLGLRSLGLHEALPAYKELIE